MLELIYVEKIIKFYLDLIAGLKGLKLCLLGCKQNIFHQNSAPWVQWVGNMTFLVKILPPGLEIGHFLVELAPPGLGNLCQDKYCILGQTEKFSRFTLILYFSPI